MSPSTLRAPDWANTEGKQITFAADPTAAFAKALDLSFDATPLLGNVRSKRYALVIENGKVKSAHVEDDPTKVEKSGADTVLG